MCAGAAAIFTDVEVRGVGVGREDHVTDTVGDAVSWVGCYEIKELINGVVCGLCGGDLLLAKFAEGDKEFDVHSACVVE